MDFELPDDLKMVQRLARDFVTGELRPLERDLLGRAADLGDAHAYLDREVETRLMEVAKGIGLWGPGVPVDLGGAGLGTLGNCVLEEELAQTVVPFDCGDVTPLLFECRPEQSRQYFTPVFNREKAAFLAFLGPGTGVPAEPSLALAVTKADGAYHLNGTRVSFSRLSDAYFAIVFGATSPGPAAVTCFLVDKGTPGFTLKGGGSAEGWRAASRPPLELVFDACQVGPDAILGKEGAGYQLGQQWLPSRRVVRGARSVGVAQRLLEEAASRAQTWQSLGRSQSERASVQAMLAEIAVSIRACRLLTHEVAWKADRGEASLRDAAMVKLCGTQLVLGVADRVAHVYGGPPYVAGLAMERMSLDPLAASATRTSLELQRSLIAREVLKGMKP